MNWSTYRFMQLVSSSLLVVSTVFLSVATMPNELVLVPPSISLLSWNTSLLKFSNWLATPLATTRSNVLSPVICSLPSVMMKSESHAASTFYQTLISNILCRLNRLLGDVVISQGGVVPFIHSELLPSKTGKGKKEGASQEV
jgi:hypothetical protein